MKYQEQQEQQEQPGQQGQSTSTSRISPELEEEVHDILNVMMKQSSTLYRKASKKSQRHHHDSWRQPMLSWVCSIIDVFQLRHDILSITAYFLDKTVEEYSSFDCSLSPANYQLVVLGALHLTIKNTETETFPLDQILKISNSEFNCGHVAAMEREILKILDWRLHPPTAECFLQQYVRLLDVSEDLKNDIQKTVEHLIRVTVVNHQYSMWSPSVVAYAAILLALEHGSQEQDLHNVVSLEAKRGFGQRMQTIADMSRNTPHLVNIYSILKPFVGKDDILVKEESDEPSSFDTQCLNDALPDQDERPANHHSRDRLLQQELVCVES